jgi:hypothetical protein
MHKASECWHQLRRCGNPLPQRLVLICRFRSSTAGAGKAINRLAANICPSFLARSATEADVEHRCVLAAVRCFCPALGACLDLLIDTFLASNEPTKLWARIIPTASPTGSVSLVTFCLAAMGPVPRVP